MDFNFNFGHYHEGDYYLRFEESKLMFGYYQNKQLSWVNLNYSNVTKEMFLDLVDVIHFGNTDQRFQIINNCKKYIAKIKRHRKFKNKFKGITDESLQSLCRPGNRQEHNSSRPICGTEVPRVQY